MKFVVKYFIVFILIVLYSFQNHIHKLESIDLVKAFKQKHNINLSFIVDSLHYIRLETNQLNYVGKFPRVYANSQYIIIIAYKQQYIFDRKSGKFMHEVGQYGRDPESYRRTKYNIAFNEDRNTLYADGWDGSIMEYSVNNELLNTFKKPKNIGLLPSFAWLNDTIYYAYVLNTTGSEKIKLIRINSKNEKILFFPNYDYFEDNPIIAKIWGPEIGLFYRYDNQLFFKELFSDTVYEVNNNTIKPKIVFNSGKYAPPSFRREFINSEEFKSYYWIQNIFESKNFVFFELFHQGKTRCGIYNKENNITSIAHSDKAESYCSDIEKYGFINDIDDFIQFCPEYINSNGEIISLVQASDIIQWFNKNPDKATKLPPHLQKLKSIKETDNPVVMIAKLKD